MKIDGVAQGEFLLSAAYMKGETPTPAKGTFLKFILVTLIFVLLAIPPFADAASASKIPEGDVWSYLIEPDQVPGRGHGKWSHLHFDDSQWPKGPSGFGFGPGKYKTRVDALRDANKKIFVRHAFVVNNPSKLKRIIVSLVSDGPCVAYINGIEVFRSTAKVTEPIDISGFAHELFPGANILAIETFVGNAQRDSFSFVPSLETIED